MKRLLNLAAWSVMGLWGVVLIYIVVVFASVAANAACRGILNLASTSVRDWGCMAIVFGVLVVGTAMVASTTFWALHRVGWLTPGGREEFDEST